MLALMDHPSNSGPSKRLAVYGATTFTLFLKLPKELRMMIWKKMLPGPRAVELIYHNQKKTPEGRVLPAYFASRCPLPVILSVCQESRREALNKYSLSFAMINGDPKVYFDPSVDILVFSWSHIVETGQFFYAVNNVHHVEHICFTSYTIGNALRFLDIPGFLNFLPSLKALMIAADLDRRPRIKPTVTQHSQPVEKPRAMVLYDGLANLPIATNFQKPTITIGLPSIVEYHCQEEKSYLYNNYISEFLENSRRDFPGRKALIVKVMDIKRD